MVIAETLEQAKNAADIINVSYEILKAVVDPAESMNSEAIYEGIDRNLCFDFVLGDKGKADEAMSSADKVVKIGIFNPDKIFDRPNRIADDPAIIMGRLHSLIRVLILSVLPNSVDKTAAIKCSGKYVFKYAV